MTDQTLADFARTIGVSPATARQWKRRGKVVERDGGFELIAEAQKEWAGVTERDVNVTERHTVTAQRDTCAGCEALNRELEALRDRVKALERWRFSREELRSRAIDPPGPQWGA